MVGNSVGTPSTVSTHSTSGWGRADGSSPASVIALDAGRNLGVLVAGEQACTDEFVQSGRDGRTAHVAERLFGFRVPGRPDSPDETDELDRVRAAEQIHHTPRRTVTLQLLSRRLGRSRVGFVHSLGHLSHFVSSDSKTQLLRFRKLRRTTSGRSDSDRAEQSPPGERAVACTLSVDGEQERTEWVESKLLEHLTEAKERSDGYLRRFTRKREAYEAVTELAWREADCRGWATFEVRGRLDPVGERSSHEKGTRLFGDAPEEVRG